MLIVFTLSYKSPFFSYDTVYFFKGYFYDYYSGWIFFRTCLNIKPYYAEREKKIVKCF